MHDVQLHQRDEATSSDSDSNATIALPPAALAHTTAAHPTRRFHEAHANVTSSAGAAAAPVDSHEHNSDSDDAMLQRRRTHQPPLHSHTQPPAHAHTGAHPAFVPFLQLPVSAQ